MHDSFSSDDIISDKIVHINGDIPPAKSTSDKIRYVDPLVQNNKELKNNNKIKSRFTPLFDYFYTHGWIDPKKKNYFKCLSFITWSFRKCQAVERLMVFDSHQMILKPFEFICGREKNSSECGLTEKEFRGQINIYLNAGILEKTANSRANRFNSYRWVTESFSETQGQLEGQLRANQGPTEGHKEEHQEQKKEKQQVVVVSACERDSNSETPPSALHKPSAKKPSGLTAMEQSAFTKDDLYLRIVNTQQQWTNDEIEEAWNIYAKADKATISDPFAYIGGIIRKNQNKAIAQKEKSINKQKTWKERQECQKKYQPDQAQMDQEKNQEITKMKPMPGNSDCSEEDMSERPLAKFALERKMKKKLQNG